MKTLDESMQTELIDLFRGIYSTDDKIEELKASEKVYATSKREMIKNAAEKLEVRPIHIRRAYKEWVTRITNREEADAIDDIVAFLREYVEDKING